MENDTLDLNRLVVIPCGSASHVPYMVYLVRGRDAEKPPVVALLDSDKAGNDAAKAFKNDKKLKGLIDAGHVLQVGSVDLGKEGPAVQELEDYLPLPLAVAAANYCIDEVTQFRTAKAPKLEYATVEAAIADGGRPMFDAIDHAARQLGGHIEKLAFARAVVEICRDTPSHSDLNASIDVFLDRMRALFKVINVARRDAERAARKERLSQMVDRQQRLFLRDHKSTARREQAADLFEDIESLLDGSKEADAIRNRLQGLRRDFKLDDEPASQITNYKAFAEGLRGLKSALAAERLPADLPSSQGTAASSNEGEAAIQVGG